MKKSLGLLAFMLFLPFSVHASTDRVGQWDGGIQVYGNLVSDTGVGDAYYLGGSFSYGFYNWFALGISAGWADSTFEVSNAAGASIKGGRVAMVPVFADFIFRVPPTGGTSLVPYGVIGLGGIFTNLHGHGDATGLGLQADSEDGFAGKLGIGVDWFANENWIYNLETGYVFTDAGVEVRNPNGSTNSSVDLSYYYIGGGVKWVG